MSGFSPDWLALREPYDLRARNSKVRDAALALVAHLPSVTAVDLACGTGSTLRALAPLLPARQHWRLVDNDLSLLARAAPAMSTPDIRVSPTPLDLAHDLEAALDGPVDLVTTSALLDLVSEEWLERLAVEIAARRLPLYAALSYDGRIAFDPVDDFDARIVAAVNAHQSGDKGFGPALGPRAAETARRLFERVGYRVTSGESDWTFRPADRAIQSELLAGWAAAARDTGTLPARAIDDWIGRRLHLVGAGRGSARVGHIDLLTRPQ